MTPQNPGPAAVAAPPVDAPPRAAARRLRAVAEAAGRAGYPLRRAPVSVGAILVLWTLGVATTSLGSGPDPALRAVVGLGVAALAAGHWWTLFSGALWCSGTISYLGATALLLGLLAPAERRIGSGRTAGLLVGTHVLGSGFGVALVAVTAATGGDWVARLAADLAIGPSTGAVGVVLAASAGLATLWRRRLRVAMLVVLVMLALYSGSLQDILRLLGGVAGLLLGPVVLGRPTGRRRPAMSGPETRTLVALVVAASAVGPLLAAVSGTAIGPLSVLRFLVLPPPPDPAAVAAVCADPANT